jgi:peptidoglycan hydrolase-like protein with peptidoglycan-binding domain
MMSDTTRPHLKLTVHAQLDNWPLDIALSLPAEKVRSALQRLAALGYSPRQQAAAAVLQKAPRPRATAYDADGTPLCPIHSTPMLEGRRGGYYCGHKAAEGQPAGPKGYCAATAD